jgi:hypothetical protein
MSRTDTTLQLTRRQYSEFAEITKAVGRALNVSTYKEMGCWGRYSPWALLICNDVTDPETRWDERALITISRSINAGEFRAAGPSRPELNWAELEDDEIYPFVVWHEVGHRMDNFDLFKMMMMQEAVVRDQCHRRACLLNEVLADRYAWERVRPGEPIPLSNGGKRMQEKTAEAMEFVSAHVPRINASRVRPLQSGRYRDVPADMLINPGRKAFVGQKVHTKVVERIAACYHRPTP